MRWPCGHVSDLDLSWLPDERVRRRRAVETAEHSACLLCDSAEPAAIRSLIDSCRTPPTASGAQGKAVASGAELRQALAAGDRWLEVTGRSEPVMIDAHVPGDVRVDVVYRARALVDGNGPVVTSWGMTTVGAGGRVAAASGSRTELDGGAAAVSDGGVLIARFGLAVVDAGGLVILARDAHDLEVWLLPGARVEARGNFTVIRDRPRGKVMSASGELRPSRLDLPEELAGLLEASRGMGPRR